MKRIIYAASAFAPALAFAQGTPNLTGLTAIVDFIGQTIKSLIPIAFGLAIVYFFYGLAKFIRGAGDPKAQEAGRGIMIYGVIAIAVMISVYGLVAWLQNALGITPTSTTDIPTVQIP